MKRAISPLIEPRCIRIFKTKEEVEYAQKLLKAAGFPSNSSEDGFGTLKLKDLGMTSRFRLYVSRRDIEKIGVFLAKKLKEKRVEE
jgi:hypothetical protein